MALLKSVPARRVIGLVVCVGVYSFDFHWDYFRVTRFSGSSAVEPIISYWPISGYANICTVCPLFTWFSCGCCSFLFRLVVVPLPVFWRGHVPRRSL